jgi:hypothetical protein
VASKSRRDVDVHHLVSHPPAIVDNAPLAIERKTTSANDLTARTRLVPLGRRLRDAERWQACKEKSGGHPGLLHDCLGFKRPPPLTGQAAVDAQRLKAATLEECSTMSRVMNGMGDACPKLVTERFAWCAAPALTGEISTSAYERCIGFAVPDKLPSPPPEVRLFSCAKPGIKARISLRAAFDQPQEGTTRRILGAQTLYVERAPIFDHDDIENLRVGERDSKRTIWVDLSSSAAQRLHKLTRNKKYEGVLFVRRIDEEDVVVRLDPLSNPYNKQPLFLPAGQHRDDEFCQSK